MSLDSLEPRGKQIPLQATAHGRMQHRLRVARKIYAAACEGLMQIPLTDKAVHQHDIGYRLLAGTIQDVHQHLYASGRTAIPPRRLCHDQ